jgi:hypothetical protein
MQEYASQKETIITMEEVSISETVKKIFFFLAFFLLLAAAYHIFLIEPLFEKIQAESKNYYVVDMEKLIDAKVESMLKEREQTGIEKSEAEIESEMSEYVRGLQEKLLEFSHGFPIFASSAVINARFGIVDLTPELLGHFRLAADTTFDQFLKKP